MKKIGILILLLTMGLFSMAQKQINDANAQKRNLNGFHGIDVGSGIDLVLTQDNTEAVAVSASEQKYTDKIITEVKNGILHLYFDHSSPKSWFGADKKLRAYVSIKNIDLLHASSGAQVRVEGTVKAGKIDMEVSSGAGIKGSFDVQSLDVDQSSGSIARINGKAEELKVEGSSGSIFDGYDFVTSNCNAESSSGSIVRVTVNKELSVHASSGGKITYKGTGMIRNVHTSSGGNVSRKS